MTVSPRAAASQRHICRSVFRYSRDAATRSRTRLAECWVRRLRAPLSEKGGRKRPCETTPGATNDAHKAQVLPAHRQTVTYMARRLRKTLPCAPAGLVASIQLFHHRIGVRLPVRELFCTDRLPAGICLYSAVSRLAPRARGRTVSAERCKPLRRRVSPGGRPLMTHRSYLSPCPSSAEGALESD